jgi:hypothetical protein
VEQPLQSAGVWTTFESVFAPAYTVIGRPLCEHELLPPASSRRRGRSSRPPASPANRRSTPERQIPHTLRLEHVRPIEIRQRVVQFPIEDVERRARRGLVVGGADDGEGRIVSDGCPFERDSV